MRASKNGRVSRRQVLKGSGVVAAGVIAGFPAVVRSQQQKRFLKPIVAGLNAPVGDPSYISISEIPRILREKYDVTLEIQIHPNSTLGTDVSHLDAAQTGFIDITSHGQSQWSTYTDAWVFSDLPYAFTDWDMATRFVTSELFWQQAKRMEQQAPALKVLPATAASGFRMLSNTRRELRVPDDGRGIKYRTTASEVELELIRTWGGNPTPMAWTETYTALQTRVVEGIHVQPHWTFTFKMHEVLKFATKVGANFAIQIQVINKNTFNSMPEAVQKAFMLAAQDAAMLGWNLDRSLESKAEENLAKAGMQIYTPTPAELAQWREKGEGIWSKFKVERQLLDGLRAMRTA